MTHLRDDTPADPVHQDPGRPGHVMQDDPMSRTPGRLTAAVLPLTAVALMVLTVVLDVRSPHAGPGVELAPGYGWPYAGIGLVFGACCGLVLRHDRRQGIGWALGVVAFLWGIDGWSQAYVRWGIRADDVSPGVNAALWILNRFGAFLPASVAVLLAIFPTGRFLAGRWGRAGRVAVTVMGLSALTVVVAPSVGRVNDVDLPSGVDLDAGSLPMPTGFIDVAVPLANLLTVVGLLVTMATVVVRYRGAAGVERDRMRWLAWSVVAMGLVVGLSSLSEGIVTRDAALFVIATLPPVAMTIGIVRPTLVPVVDLLTSTVVFALLSVVLVVVDLAVVAVLDSALGDGLEQREVVLVVLLLTVVLYGPLRQRLSEVVRRLLYGERGRPYDVVAGLASTLEQADEGPEQLAAVADAVAAAFGIRYVRLEVDRGNGARLVATHGVRPAEVRTLPIAYRDQPVGRVELPVRGLRSRLSRRDEQLLGDLVRQAASAARTSRLADELQESRERLVVAREEERRRIRRDLHDGLGPSLSGVVYQLESVRLLAERDPDAAQRTIATVSENLQDVVADVRRLVHDLRPPALDDLGLVGALRQQAATLGAAGLSTTVEADDLGPLPAAVEVAAYRIVGESMTNAAKHAHASRLDVTLTAEDGRLLIEVTDDGAGIPARAEAGVGLVSLRERASELGGRIEVVCPPQGGTVVRAWLPLSGSTTGEDRT